MSLNQKPVPTPSIPGALDVAAIRARTRYDRGFRPYTQANFARAIGVPAETVRQWEQGRRQPTGAARVLLALIAQNPSIVGETLSLRDQR